MHKLCTKCRLWLPVDSFRFKSTGKDQLTARCISCIKDDRERNRQKYNANAREQWQAMSDDEKYRRRRCVRQPWQRQKSRIRANATTRRLRDEVNAIYGGHCVCCGEPRREFLSIDHVNGGGAAEAKLLTTNGILRKLIEATKPMSDYRLLCFNCNMARGFYDYCPHESSLRLTAADFSSSAQRRNRYRRDVLTKYGGKCKCCGESHYEFLAIDHINGRQIGETTRSLVDRLWRETEILEGIRILCHNCNESIASYGLCPHDPVNFNFKIDGQIRPQRAGWRAASAMVDS